MSTKFRLSILVSLLCFIAINTYAEKDDYAILLGKNSSDIEKLATKEIRRYVYLRCDKLLPVLEKIKSGKSYIVVANKDQALLQKILPKDLKLRGIQPFHDFPEGPDWWNIDGYKAVLAQLPKMRMNFFGLHTYP